MPCQKTMNAICEQDHSESNQLLVDNLADNVNIAKAAHSMNQSISNKGIIVYSSSHRNPASLFPTQATERLGPVIATL